MSSFNKAILMGNLTRDPEVRALPGGQTVCEIGMACNRSYAKGGAGGEKVEEVTFVDVSFWGRTGEIIAEHLHRGDPIFVEGRLTFRSWEAKDGSKRSKLSVTGENFQFVGGKGEGAGGGGRGGPPAAGSDIPDGFDDVPF